MIKDEDKSTNGTNIKSKDAELKSDQSRGSSLSHDLLAGTARLIKRALPSVGDYQQMDSVDSDDIDKETAVAPPGE